MVLQPIGLRAGKKTPAELVITTDSLPGMIVGLDYSITLQATGGKKPYSWSVVAGALPAGLFLSPDGILFGTPTTNGSFDFTIEVADASGRTNRGKGTGRTKI